MMSLRQIGLLCMTLASAPVVAEPPVLVSLAWHDIVAKRNSDPYAVTVAQFREQLSFLKENGYKPVSLEQCVRAWRGEATLPPKAVLLTFDDGLRSYDVHARPLLAEFGFPSVLSVVTGWVDGVRRPPEYQGKLLDWASLKRLIQEPGIAIVSHSDNLHHGVLANPQGNLAPAAVTRQYLNKTHRYESEKDYEQRVRGDLRRSQQRLITTLGTAPPAITWPYGAWNAVSVRVAREVGMPLQLTLASWQTDDKRLPQIHRQTFHRYRGIPQLEEMLNPPPRPPVRFIAIELDRVGTAPASEQERILSALINRLTVLRATGLIIDPFTGDGRAAYFPQTALPVKADLLGHVLHQISERTAIQALYVRIPQTVAGSKLMGLATALAGMAPVYGLVLASNVEAGLSQSVRFALQQRHSLVRVGTSRALTEAWDEMAILVTVSPALPEQELRRAIEDLPSARSDVLMMIDNQWSTPAAQIADQMNRLRALGIRNFGYAYDAWDQDVPPVMTMIDAFHGHTIGED